jgi:hypothetical protein
MKYCMYLCFLVGLSGCIPSIGEKETKTSKKKADKDGINRTYYADGKLRSEVPIKDGKKNGLARDFYADGRPRLEIEYVNSVKHGLTKMYYQNGNIYEETPYENGNIHGVQRKFRENGKLSAEAPHASGEPCVGLKEYLVDGSPKKNFPTIVITPINNLLKQDKYTLKLTMSDNAKNVTFYTGKMDNNCLGTNLERVFETPQKGVSEISYYLSPGMYVMEELNIVAKVKTLQGNYYVTQRKYNVAVENR